MNNNIEVTLLKYKLFELKLINYNVLVDRLFMKLCIE